MIQFNLLPDVKKEYIKAKRTKRLIISASFIAGVSSIVLVVLMFSFVKFAQQKNIDDLTNDIESEIAVVNSVEDINEILTIQNQLNTLPGLHEGKPEASRVFALLSSVTPANVSIGSVDLDIENSRLKIQGSASSLALVNQYADTLKFATYKTNDTSEGKPFTKVITQSARSDESTSYTISMDFDSVLFDNTIVVEIIVPNTVTTRSTLGQPGAGQNDLFIEVPAEEQ